MTKTWADLPEGTGYGLAHLPFGLVSDDPAAGASRHPAVRIGNHALPLEALAANGLFEGVLDDPGAVFATDSLNAFLATGPTIWRRVRKRLQVLLSDVTFQPFVRPLLMPLGELTMHLPFEVADYVDFYASEQHARNVGAIFRPDGDPLPKNWKHLPAGYHGRAGSVVVSGTPIVRPCGQRPGPTYGPSLRLDIEAEVGFVVGVPSEPGRRVPVDAFADHVFGVVLLNDWSARDIQQWESVPLGPFLGKSFATSVSAWVTPLEALLPSRVALGRQRPQVLPYLAEAQPWGYDITLEVRWNGEAVSHPPFRTQYWSPAQQLAHLTVGGAGVRTGDLFASGTVSGPAKTERGSFLELTWNGTDPVTLADGSTRTFLEDGDRVTVAGSATAGNGELITIGRVTGTIQPAIP